MGFPPERHQTPTGRLGLNWATLPRLPHPGIQYVVAPALDDGTLDMANGIQDAWRDPAAADAAREAAERTWPLLTFHVWSREVGWFRIDD